MAVVAARLVGVRIDAVEWWPPGVAWSSALRLDIHPTLGIAADPEIWEQSVCSPCNPGVVLPSFLTMDRLGQRLDEQTANLGHAGALITYALGRETAIMGAACCSGA